MLVLALGLFAMSNVPISNAQAARQAPADDAQQNEQLREDLDDARTQTAEAAALAQQVNEELSGVRADVENLTLVQRASSTQWSTVVLAFLVGVVWALLVGRFAARFRRRFAQKAVPEGH
ncbi:MAG: hypothetical protein GEU74_14360 [Nitriliruptorales bacterium]|nr:hypothetical protein [Nitriliruptorales bacterium]